MCRPHLNPPLRGEEKLRDESPGHWPRPGIKNKTIGNEAHRYRPERISRDRIFVARLLGSSGFAGLFKTTSNLYAAGGLIFKGLIGYSSMITQYSTLRRKPLKIRPLLNQGAI
jgi:hypothetical protein